jgi:Rha family phage regulatory protein
MSNNIILSQDGGIVTADSLGVADHFGKQHPHVMRDIDQLQKDLSNFGEMFFESTYQDSYGRNQRCFNMTRDGFTLLAMGFTGSEALHWKVAYMKAFNELERRASQPMSVPEMLLHQAQYMVDAEKRMNGLEANQLELTHQVEHITRAIVPIEDDWQGEMVRRIKSVCHEFDLSYEHEYRQLYATLESRGFDLRRRQQNMRARLAAEGATQTRQDAVTLIAVVASDTNLRAHFERVLQDWTIFVSRTYA